MKKIKLLFLSLIGILIITSWSTNINVHIPGYKTSTKVEKGDSKKYVSNSKNQKAKSKKYNISSSENETEDTDFEASVNPSLDKNYSSVSLSKKNNYYQNTPSDDECDNIILRNGDEIKAKVIEITETSVKYRKCDNLNGPLYSQSKSAIFMVQYVNGTKDVFNEEQDTVKDEKENKNVSTSSDSTNKQDEDKSKRTTDKVSINSLVFSLLGVLFLIVGVILNAPLFIIAAFVFLIVAFILGIIGIHRANKYPDKYKGMGMAIAGFVIGLLGVIVLTISLVAVAAFI